MVSKFYVNFHFTFYFKNKIQNQIKSLKRFNNKESNFSIEQNMTDSFKDISITLSKDGIRQHVFYSNDKNWRNLRRYSIVHKPSQTAFKEMSCTTEFVKNKVNHGFDASYTKLEDQLNEKNVLLIKQSKWKNYYLKQEISVLLDEILQQLDSLLQNEQPNGQLRAYRKKLEKMINKVQMKKKSQVNWIEFFGFSPINQHPKKSDSDLLKGQHRESIIPSQLNQYDSLTQEMSTIKEQNKKLIQSLNILTLEIQNKQVEINQLQDKYAKLKTKRQFLKTQLTELHQKYETLLAEHTQHKEKFAQQNTFFPAKTHHKSHHFHTYSLDRDIRSQNSNLLIPSEKPLYIQEDSEKLFTLSDTPFIVINKQIPPTLQYFEARKKLLSSENQVSEKEGAKLLKGKNVISKSNSINQSQQNSLNQMVLCQALAIEKLLERI